MVFALAGCHRPVNELYEANAFNTGRFMNNYYTSWNGVDKIDIKEENIKTFNVTPYVEDRDRATDEIEGLKEGDQLDKNGELLSWKNDDPDYNKEDGYGPYNSLINYDSEFAYGYLSKLYDGRVRCDGYQALSRVQLDKVGYATYFPKALSTYKYFGFAVRGGTDCSKSFYETEQDPSDPQKLVQVPYFPELDYDISFIRHDLNTGVYSKFVFHISDLVTQTNNGGKTSFIFFYFEDILREEYGDAWNTVLQDTIAMSFTFKLKNYYQEKYEHRNPTSYKYLVDDKNDTTESTAHFALMLYEVMFPGATWH